MKYIGTTKLEHGIVMHYGNNCGNIESHFIENVHENSECTKSTYVQ